MTTKPSKTCPWCGCAPNLVEDEAGQFYYSCPNIVCDMMQVNTRPFPTEQQAREAWDGYIDEECSKMKERLRRKNKECQEWEEKFRKARDEMHRVARDAAHDKMEITRLRTELQDTWKKQEIELTLIRTQNEKLVEMAKDFMNRERRFIAPPTIEDDVI